MVRDHRLDRAEGIQVFERRYDHEKIQEDQCGHGEELQDTVHAHEHAVADAAIDRAVLLFVAVLCVTEISVLLCLVVHRTWMRMASFVCARARYGGLRAVGRW